MRICVALMFTSAVFVPYLNALGAPEGGIFIVEFVFMGTWALAAVPCGRLSDRWSRSRMVQMGTAVCCLSTIGYACASEFWHSLVAEALLALGFAFQVSSVEPLVVETLVHEGQGHRSRKELGRQSAAWLWGSAIASVLGGCIALLGIRWTMVLSIVPQVAACCIALGLQDAPKHVREHPPLRNTLRVVLKECPLRLGITLFSGVAFACLLSLVWFMQMLQVQEQHSFVFFGIVNTVTLLATGAVSHGTHVLERWGVDDRLLLLCTAGVLVTALVSPLLWGPLIGLGCIALGRVMSGINQTVLSDIVARLGRGGDHTSMISVQVVWQRICFCIACSLIVLALPQYGLERVMCAAGCIAAACFLVCLCILHLAWARMPPRGEPMPTDDVEDPAAETPVL